MARRSHRVCSAIGALTLFLFAMASGLWPAGASGGTAELDSYLRAAIKRHNIPGLAVAVTEGDRIVFSQGYGKAGAGRVMTADTPCYIGSQTKSFTAMAILQLAEQGKVALDAPVCTYLPWFRVADEQASKTITLRHLLQHTSGLAETGYTSHLPPDASLEDLVRDLARAPQRAAVGAQMQYFNPGYSTLGLVIETVSGQSYDDYLREHIFQPLKMTSSFTQPEEARAAGLAQGYGQIFGLAVPLPQPHYPYDLPAGFIISSAHDMARYMVALANGGELDGVRVLSEESVDLLFTPNSQIGSPYGLGWFISTYYGEPQITHGGDNECFHTAVLLLPERGLSLVLLVNENHLLKDMHEYSTLLWGAAALLTDHPLPPEKVSSTLYGWALAVVWVVVVGLAVRKLTKLPAWRDKMATWGPRRRVRDLLNHGLGIAVSAVMVAVVAPAWLGRGFSLRWFVGFLPDVALIVGTLMLDDALQMVLKVVMMVRQPPSQSSAR